MCMQELMSNFEINGSLTWKALDGGPLGEA